MTKNLRLHSIALLLLAACAALSIGARQAPERKPEQPKAPQNKEPQKEQTEPVLRIETELVQLDLVVADKQGKLVRDLKRADFELLEDGKPQPITHFAVGTAARPAAWLKVKKSAPNEPAAKSSVTTETAAAGRFIVLAVDDYHLEPENLLRARRTLLRFINEQMVGGDQMAVATTSGSIGMYQQFTSERPVLERALNRLSVQTRRSAAHNSLDIPRISDYQAELIDLGDHDALELAVQEILRNEPPPPPPPRGGGGQPGGGFTPRDRAAAQAQSKARTIVAENAHFTHATLSVLEQIIRSLNALNGRKMLILLSDGFFLGGTRNSQHYDIRRITDAATRAGVVIYGIDSRGLVATVPGGDASSPGRFEPTLPGAQARIENSAVHAKLDGLNALAYDTGGFLVLNTNDLNFGLQRVLDDNETYYVLAYEPAAPYRDGRFHKLEVRVVDHPELKVRTRKGYFAPVEKAAAKTVKIEKPKSPEKAAQAAKVERESQMRNGLGSLFPLRDIQVDLAADFIDTAESGPGLIINSHLDAGTLNFKETNGTHQTTVDLVAVVFDENGKVATGFSDRFALNLTPARLEQAVQQGFSYRRMVALKPGFYQARIAVREDGSARLGTATRWVEVPDLSKKQLALSGVLLSAGDEADGATLPSEDEQKAGYQPRPARASRRFSRGGSLDFMVFTYNAKADKGAADLVIQSQVYSGSKLIYATPLVKMAPPEGVKDEQSLRRIAYAARLSLADFAAGEYELRLLVIDRLAKTNAFRRVNFTVE